MGVEYTVTQAVTITCDRCGKSSHISEHLPASENGVNVTSVRLRDLARKVQQQMGAKGMTLDGTSVALCGDCATLVASVITPVRAVAE